MAVGMDVIVAVAMGSGWNHGKVLYCNITAVHIRKHWRTLAGPAGCVPHAEDHDPGRVRAIENHVRVRAYHEWRGSRFSTLRPLFVSQFESASVLIYLKTMNHSEIAKQLAQAEREVAADAANVERQRTLVAELA
jgi:hypothetical protein